MNDSLKVRKRAERLVDECKGDYYRHHFCDICPMMYVVSFYDEETGEYCDKFRCDKLKR